MFCRRETGCNDPDPNSRRELINRYIREHPGKNTQQIADSLGISRSSLTYYLHQLEAAGSILSVRYGGQQHFLPANIGLNEHQKNLLPLLSKEKDHLFFQTLLSHPACTRQELSAELGISVTTVVWYIQRLKRSRMLTTTKQNRSSQYSLTPEAVTAYQEPAEASENSGKRDGGCGGLRCGSVFSGGDFDVGKPDRNGVVKAVLLRHDLDEVPGIVVFKKLG